MEIEGRNNYDTDDAYIGEINGVNYDATTYVFPKDKSIKNYSISFATPVENTLTFTPKVKQCILAFTLYTDATSSIAGITVDNKLMADTNIYDLSGRVVAQKRFRRSEERYLYLQQQEIRCKVTYSQYTTGSSPVNIEQTKKAICQTADCLFYIYRIILLFLFCSFFLSGSFLCRSLLGCSRSLSSSLLNRSLGSSSGLLGNRLLL